MSLINFAGADAPGIQQKPNALQGMSEGVHDEEQLNLKTKAGVAVVARDSP